MQRGAGKDTACARVAQGYDLREGCARTSLQAHTAVAWIPSDMLSRLTKTNMYAQPERTQ